MYQYFLGEKLTGYLRINSLLKDLKNKGIARGGPGLPVTTNNSWQKRHDNLVSALTLTQCDPLFKKSWLRPSLRKSYTRYKLCKTTCMTVCKSVGLTNILPKS